jgi:hypothetical protein
MVPPYFESLLGRSFASGDWLVGCLSSAVCRAGMEMLLNSDTESSISQWYPADIHPPPHKSTTLISVLLVVFRGFSMTHATWFYAIQSSR